MFIVSREESCMKQHTVASSDCAKVRQMLHPGEDIRPHLSRQTAKALVHRLYGLKDVTIEELDGYDDKNYHVKICGDKNTSCLWPHGYVLKVMNSLDSQNLPLVEAQTETALHLGAHGINCPQPVKNLSGKYYSLEELAENAIGTGVGKDYGEQEKIENRNTKIILHGFQHPAFGKNRSIWALDSVPLLREFVFAVEDADKNALVHTVIDAFEREVVSLIGSLEKGKCEVYNAVHLFMIHY
ncbi:hypothetical protein Cfor_10462 [Coptotermes formosanus]|uniref:Aminoglycoside phosphotransferase domain-containing protein n=1 Tax=Coptotermes formosanus TaxID=36987 RepID=A0A6L2PMC7_COPFO|nr:hypothetical protein Cfor_10462 [Coptotermes formosanus]